MVIGIDVGGTYTKVGLWNEDDLIQWYRQPTPRNVAKFSDLVGEIVHRTSQETSVRGVGIGIPGVYDFRTEKITAPNLGWFDLPKDTVFRDSRIPVFFGNDANLAALGEFVYGTGRSRDPFVLLTIGTGIGMGIIVNGDIMAGFSGRAGELSHVMLEEKGPLCHCGERGCVEKYCTVNAVNAEDVGDNGCFSEGFAANLRRTVDMVQKLFDPEIIAVGGGFSEMNHARSLLNSLQFNTENRTARAPHLELAHLRNRAGMIGAALLANRTIA